MTIPIIHTGVSGGFVQTLIQTQREKLFSGHLYLRYPSGENLIFVLLDGVQQKLYRSLEQNMEVIPRESWPAYTDRADASISLLSLPLEGLRLMRVAHEATITDVERASLSTRDLTASIGKWAAEQSPSIVHLQGESINKLYLIAGNANPVIEELTFTGSGARFSISDTSFPNMLPQREYRVERYVSDNKYPVWQEYELRFAIHPFMRMLLARFSELAGHVLTERLCEQLSMRIEDCGWNITITTNGVSHHHFFESLDDARKAYLEIVRSFIEFAGPAIGMRLANGIAREILLKLNPYHRSLLQEHIYDRYATAGAIGIEGRQI